MHVGKKVVGGWMAGWMYVSVYLDTRTDVIIAAISNRPFSISTSNKVRRGK